MRGPILAAMLIMTPLSSAEANDARPASAGAPPQCTFESLSIEDRRRFQSRYNRRLRTDGKAVADAWLQEQACPAAAQQAARMKHNGEDGRPCKHTRLEMRVTPGFDGPMTMAPVPVCAD